MSEMVVPQVEPEAVPPAAPSANTTLSLDALSDDELALKILEKCQAVAATVATVKNIASLALRNALEAGELLLEARRRAPDGEWLEWLKVHCPDIPRSTAYRFIGLAEKFPHVRNAELAGSLRQAYVLCGILQEAPATKNKPPNLNSIPTFTGTDLVARVKSMREFYGTTLGQIDTATLEEPIRRDLRDEITALLAVLSEFIEGMGVEKMKAAKAVEITPKTARAKK